MPLITAAQFNKVVDSKILNKVYKAAKENPASFAAKMALVSALTKDTVGCYYYVTQSLNNKKIPEDKRNFVASIDLMNGILNVALQFTIGIWLDKKSPKFFESLISKKLSEVDTRKIAKKLETIVGKPEISAESIEHFLRNKMLGTKGKTALWLNIGFGAATMLFATQILTKRVLVPFLATPLAGWYSNKFLDKKKNKKDDESPVIEPLNNKLSYQALRSPSSTTFDAFNKR